MFYMYLLRQTKQDIYSIIVNLKKYIQNAAQSKKKNIYANNTQFIKQTTATLVSKARSMPDGMAIRRLEAKSR